MLVSGRVSTHPRALEVQLDVAKTLRRTTSSPYWQLDMTNHQGILGSLKNHVFFHGNPSCPPPKATHPPEICKSLLTNG